MQTGIERGACNFVANLGRRADGDRIETGLAQHVVQRPVRRNPGNLGGRVGRADELEGIVPANGGHVLVPGDLAQPHNTDPHPGQSRSQSGNISRTNRHRRQKLSKALKPRIKA